MSDPIASAAARTQRLPLRHKFSGAFGQIVDGAVGYPLGLFLLFYATAVCGLPGGLAGVAIAAGLIVDAVLDPLIGSASDRWRSRLGRRLPFMLVGFPAVAILLVAIFSLPTGLSTPVLFVYLMVVSILLRISLSLFMLPYQATVPELSEDYSERSSIIVWRFGIGMVGSLAAIGLGFGYFFAGTDGLSNRAAYSPFALAMAALVLVGGAVASRSLYRTRDREHAPEASAGIGQTFSELAQVFRNPSFRILFIGSLLFFTALGTHGSLALHANTYFWKLKPEQVQIVTLSIFVGLVIGAPLAGPILKILDKKVVAAVGILGLGIAQCLPAALRLAGVFPFEAAELMAVLAAFYLFGGILMASAAVSFSSMMADAADEHEYLFQSRREGMYYAGLAFATKAASGAGALFGGLVLQVIQFPAVGEHDGELVAVSADTVRHLGLFYGPAVGLAFLASAAVLTGYRMNARKHATIMADLTERRRSMVGVEDLLPSATQTPLI
jgi:GPH family glycoside/pentoside/hexuronide:cation symporter